MRELNSRQLYDIGFYYARCLPTKDEADARDKMDQGIRNALYEEETGMPAVTQMYPAADAAKPAPPVDVMADAQVRTRPDGAVIIRPQGNGEEVK